MSNKKNKKNKVDIYRIELNKDLLKILAEEREKEENRGRLMNECCLQEEKLNLEKIFGVERAQATHNIVNLNKLYMFNV